MMKKILMMCGLGAALIYTGTVILGGMIRPEYSHLKEAISELVADGAPNRLLLSSLFLVYNALVSLFGLGLFLKALSHPRGRVLGIAGSLVLMLLVGISGVLMELAFPQDPGGLPTTFAGTMHIVMAGVASLGTMAAVLLLGLWFRNFPELKKHAVYSLVSVAVIFVSGGFTAAAMANQFTYFGILERVTIGTFIVWLFVMGYKLGQLQGTASSPLQPEFSK